MQQYTANRIASGRRHNTGIFAAEREKGGHRRSCVRLFCRGHCRQQQQQQQQLYRRETEYTIIIWSLSTKAKRIKRFSSIRLQLLQRCHFAYDALYQPEQFSD